MWEDSTRDLREKGRKTKAEVEGQHHGSERRERRPKRRLKDSIWNLREKGRKTKADVGGQHQGLEREGKEDQSGG